MFVPFPETILATSLSFALFYVSSLSHHCQGEKKGLIGTFQSSVLRGEWKKDTEALMSFGLVRVSRPSGRGHALSR